MIPWDHSGRVELSAINSAINVVTVRMYEARTQAHRERLQRHLNQLVARKRDLELKVSKYIRPTSRRQILDINPTKRSRRQKL